MSSHRPSNSSESSASRILACPAVWLPPVLLAVLAAVDSLLQADPTIGALFGATSLGLLAGAAWSVGIASVYWLVMPRSGRVQVLLWTTLGGVFAFSLMERLSVFVRLNTAYRKVAFLALVISIVVAGVGVVAGALLQPRSGHPRGFSASAPMPIRLGIGLLGLLGAGFCLALERSELSVTYPFSMLPLCSLALLSLLVAVATNVPPKLEAKLMASASRAPRAVWVLVAGLVLSGPLLVDRTMAAELQAGPYSSLALQTSRWLLDLDRDGYSGLLADGDCDELARNVHPGAREQPGNQIDDDCRMGDSTGELTWTEPEGTTVAAKPSPHSVVLITVDTVSAERTSVYGYSRETTPNLKRWASERAVVFENAYTTGSSTAVALSANFRGVYPRRLKWSRMARTTAWRYLTVTEASQQLQPGEMVTHWYRLPTEEPRPSLLWWLRRRGIRTLAATPLHMALPGTGITGEFDELVALHEKGTHDPDDLGATRQALEWLKTKPTDEPFFLWVHYLGPHTPTVRDPGVPWFGPSSADGYDHEIATFDHRVAPLLEELARLQDEGEPIAVAVTSDHGEQLSREQGGALGMLPIAIPLRFHGHLLSESVARVPMLLSVPGIEPRRIHMPANTVDLFPTVLSLTQTTPPSGLDGMDLMPVLRGDVEEPKRTVISEAWMVGKNDRIVSNKIMVTDGQHRFQRDFVTRTDEVLALSNERGGRPGINLLDEVDVSHLEGALERYLDQTGVHPFPATGQRGGAPAPAGDLQ
ncbi:MAG: hypothetical protein CL928_06120 [Deltaproteobacteria bacterium]|nr:hypothetical protein [Deltaproteobacteria bacterium]